MTGALCRLPAVRRIAKRKPEARALPTIGTLVDVAYARLRKGRLAYGHGTENAWDEAVYLVLHALSTPLEAFPACSNREISLAKSAKVLALIDERVQRRVPAAYLTHEAWLGEYRFYVDERVIVPRSFIAELLREKFSPWLIQPSRIKRALDLCTGSGCLAVLIAKTFPGAQVDATDISREALAVAHRNVTAYRLGRRVSLIEADMFSASAGKRYDLIVANPPYVSVGNMRKLPREHRYEPRLALASGKDGFDAVRAILSQAAVHLNAEGLLVVEVGHNRKRLEKAFPHLPFVWPHTSAGNDCVFMLYRRDLPEPVAMLRRATPVKNGSVRG